MEYTREFIMNEEFLAKYTAALNKATDLAEKMQQKGVYTRVRAMISWCVILNKQMQRSSV